jgi:hypothetical protein
MSIATTSKPGTRPDISGTWERTPDDWFGENPDDPVHPGGPMDLKAPYASEYAEFKKKQAAANEAGTPLATTSARCLPEGMPTLMAALFPIQIIHDDKQVVVLGEYLQQVRRIILNEAMPAKETLDPVYQGHSRGHWEGDTLVVETRNLTDRTGVAVNGGGNRHSENMVLTERFTRIAPDRVQYEATFNDPETWTEPWTVGYPLTEKSDYQIYEYACHEGNNAMRNMLSAARAREAEAGN